MSVDLWLRSELLQMPGLAHVFTTRLGGVSSGPFAELNLKYPLDSQDETGAEAAVRQNREQVCQALGFSLTQLVACQQVHGVQVQELTSAEAGRGALSHADGFAATDGLITAESGLLLMVMVADCYPVLMADPVRAVAAAVHSGWRGTQQQIARIALQKMQRYGSRPEDIRYVVGPGIGFERFEVGAEVVEAFKDQIDTTDPQLVKQLENAKQALNLPAILRLQALAEGVPATQIEILPYCTIADQRFYSYRREQGRTGRQAGFIGWR